MTLAEQQLKTASRLQKSDRAALPRRRQPQEDQRHRRAQAGRPGPGRDRLHPEEELPRSRHHRPAGRGRVLRPGHGDRPR
ncbi:MAG: hypothetical protein MZW92_68610 [Comamonadaceae bacterium]|nr:hypothetical protein [Comamonadaceae bacterium]